MAPAARTVALLTFALIFCASFALDCTVFSGNACNSCASVPGCGWCPGTWACLNGNASGPLDGSHCDSFRVGSEASCVNCDAYSSSCVQCVDHLDCGWNSQQNLCEDASNPGVSRNCPCKFNDQCTDCLLHDCVFCASSGQCYDKSDSIPTDCQSADQCNCNLFHTNCSLCNQQTDICMYCYSSSTCDVADVSTCDQWDEYCSVALMNGWSVPSFVGGLFVGLFLMLIVTVVVFFVMRARIIAKEKTGRSEGEARKDDKSVMLDSRSKDGV